MKKTTTKSIFRDFLVALIWIIGGLIFLIFLCFGITERDLGILVLLPITFAFTFWIKEFVRYIFGENSIYDSEINW